ncbi:hypothetical protein [Manganibacter manganicus]|uniref:Uncharacterized protein n=1 Tax=Manganibacter manganicus TaxID=1873176 RepID=A0A1V8RNZ9_9HYPH|nr:hypothetical protein [Pseudaminobacter manganicus]OQM74920.1 hypothetical protein BFN67_04715 [Pseudaminobacter manganicus]
MTPTLITNIIDELWHYFYHHPYQWASALLILPPALVATPALFFGIVAYVFGFVLLIFLWCLYIAWRQEG